MRHGTIEKKWENEECEEITAIFPAKNEVCPECEGTGYVLAGGLRGADYTAEEFFEAFEPDEREEYFRPGGAYDTTCDVCHGTNVVSVVDEQSLTAEQKKLFDEYIIWQTEWDRQEREYAAECAAERRAGC
jgi:hypothetical protein